jgi:arginyl-tRNA synthetase
MLKDKFKTEIATISVSAFGELLPDLKKDDPEFFAFNAELIYKTLEKPKNPDMGNYALPLFEVAKEKGLNPVEVNKNLIEIQNRMASEQDHYAHLVFSAVGGFNNCRVDTELLAAKTILEIHKLGNDYGSSDEGEGKNIVIDFSSPNIAKPFGIGHLRSTSIGHSLYRIFDKFGYNSIGINHLGDWGTQFGKLIVSFRKWGREDDLKEDAVRKLYELYVRYHKEEESNPELSELAREAFRRLEEGHEEEARLWDKFKEYSITAFEKTYNRLGIKFDYYTGESFYNDKMEPAIVKLEKAGLLEVSQGALTVNLDEFKLQPCLLKKSDGATLYATRDLAGILYRWETFKFDRALYVVGSAQQDHFRQVFRIIELLDRIEKSSPDEKISPRLVHVDFGWIKFRDEMMSTRKGSIILLDDVLDRAAELAREKIIEKNPDLKEIDKTAGMIGVGAVIFADLATRRKKDVNFYWDEVLSF